MSIYKTILIMVKIKVNCITHIQSKIFLLLLLKCSVEQCSKLLVDQKKVSSGSNDTSNKFLNCGDSLME